MKSATVARLTTLSSATKDVSLAVVIHAAPSTTHHPVILKLATVCAKRMSKANAVKNVVQVSSISTWKTVLVARHASATATRQSVRAPTVIRSCRPHRASTSTRNAGWPSTKAAVQSILNTISLDRVFWPRPEATNTFTSQRQIAFWAISVHHTIVCLSSACNWLAKVDRTRRRLMSF